MNIFAATEFYSSALCSRSSAATIGVDAKAVGVEADTETGNEAGSTSGFATSVSCHRIDAIPEEVRLGLFRVAVATLLPSYRWRIRARVTNKSEIKSWNNAKGSGNLFSMELADESGEIRATAFKQECDKYAPASLTRSYTPDYLQVLYETARGTCLLHRRWSD